ncbi:MAG: carboxylating nicotinate-nucleotide diphosphorylase [Candidatus Omnitrophica bacterium]|nr:carboxylating nicotinate-nucleotide diphosphorylase [Candidatus Omnitrophota bacterium]MDD5237020.1 carboxylating nicotinate-nucleotide diphosphorylase [Candidatus Omnitrophota bacterium]MDD5610432.1 carboxylating nicotinate-nucleotide diphosphorylase [Candidatus Omnitrophota bacterium]
MSYVNEFELKNIVRSALAEDIGKKDLTTEAFIPVHKQAKAEILAKGNFVVCGLYVAELVFKTQDKALKFRPLVKEGDLVKKGKALAIITGKANSILTAERTALNFLSLLSGVATKTRKFSEAVKKYKAKIIDTRKTVPGLRILEKYAVRIGGGFNHRLSLDEMLLVKDNHLKVIGGVTRLHKANRRYVIEIEVKNLKEFKQALRYKPDMIMLDNMKIEDMRKAVRLRNVQSSQFLSLPRLEASGGVSLKNIRNIASTGVDLISIGNLTHSIDSVDISLEIL